MPYKRRLRLLLLAADDTLLAPAAAHIANRDHGDRIEARSAGTVAGERDLLVLELLRECGIDLGAHRPHGADEADYAWADLVLTLDEVAREAMAAAALAATTQLRHRPVPDPGGLDHASIESCLATLGERINGVAGGLRMLSRK